MTAELVGADHALQPSPGNGAEATAEIVTVAFLHRIASSLPVVIAYVDADERYRYASDVSVRWHSYSAQEIVGRTVLEAVGSENYAAVEPYLRRALAGERVIFETSFTLPDVGRQFIRGTYTPDVAPSGEVRGFVALAENISDQVLATERMVRLQGVSASLSRALGPAEVAEVVVEEIRLLLGASVGIAAILSDDGRAFATLRTVGIDDAGIRPFAATAVDGPSMFGEAVRRGEPVFVESSALVGEDRVQPSSTFAAIGVDAAVALPLLFEGRPIGAIGFGYADDRIFSQAERDLLRTVSELCAQAMERARLHAAESATRAAMEAAVRLRDEFLASASHDLKTPLTVIKGRAQLSANRAARLDSGQGDRIVESMQAIQSAADAMGGQIDELLDVSLMRVGQSLSLDIQPVDLVELVRDEVTRWRPLGSGQEVRFVLPVAAREIFVDAARLRRVLWNLLGNAAKYSPGGEPITVTVDVEPGDGPSHPGWGLVSVQDQGIGIPAADLERVFDRFHRAANALGRAKGTGLGLAGVKHIVELHGGQVTVASVEGAGSTFSVRLPLGPWTGGS